MRIIQFNLDKPYVCKRPISACIGYFDGLHLGHVQLINKTIEKADEYHIEPSLITFDPDPWVTIKGIDNIQHLSSMKQRINRASSLGIKNIIILNFTKEMASLSPEDFYERVLKPLNIKSITCGFDFHYGSKGSGNCETLKKNIEDVNVVECVQRDNEKISSTRITRLIEEGNIEKANELLGYDYTIEGKVIYGHQQGRTIGFPTANLKIDKEFILPRCAVYGGIVIIKHKTYKCMVNVGHNPTFNTSKFLSVEAHVLDFNEYIYGERISLKLINLIREEQKFSNKSNLALQLEQDVLTVRKTISL